MMLDLARLRTLRELAIRKTMAAVAEALFVSPSAVSQQISMLESEAGVQLVERRGRGVTLTLAGESLVAHAERIIAVLEEAKTDLAEMKRSVTGEVRLSAFPSIAAALVPDAIQSLERSHPRLRIMFEEMEPNDSLAALRAWQSDVAIIDDLTVPPEQNEGNIERIEIAKDVLCVVLAPSHPLVARDSISILDLKDDRWAIDRGSHSYTEVVVNACRAVRFEPVINGSCNGFEVVLSLVEAGCSISIQPSLRFRDYRGKLKVKKLTPEIRRTIFIAFRRGERRNPAIATLVRQLEDGAKLLGYHPGTG